MTFENLPRETADKIDIQSMVLLRELKQNKLKKKTNPPLIAKAQNAYISGPCRNGYIFLSLK